MTIVAQGRACLFAEVAGEQMRLNKAGGMVQEVCWGLSQQFPGVEAGCFVVMPNHVHEHHRPAGNRRGAPCGRPMRG